MVDILSLSGVNETVGTIFAVDFPDMAATPSIFSS